ncbi:DUF1656 domain-containing protein [Microbulbifer sp. SAOS-129_SWC]|uniref:DUF1656 domain-containing protein n=1 Tax=Microbulbifer sp. SAOS-129_SWC TaxID=3145235 RepID=UPI0032163882
MPRELAVMGVLFPFLLPVFLLSLALLWALDRLLGRYGLYRYIWHPPLFRVAVFFASFGALGLLAMG